MQRIKITLKNGMMDNKPPAYEGLELMAAMAFWHQYRNVGARTRLRSAINDYRRWLDSMEVLLDAEDLDSVA